MSESDFFEFGGIRAPEQSPRSTISGFGMCSGDPRHVGDRPQLPHCTHTAPKPVERHRKRKTVPDWASADADLGKLTDTAIAQRLGCGITAVTRRRRQRGIPPVPRLRMKRQPPRYDWAAVAHALGVWSDSVVAGVLGCSVSAVCRHRRANGITSAQAGEDEPCPGE